VRRPVDLDRVVGPPACWSGLDRDALDAAVLVFERQRDRQAAFADAPPDEWGVDLMKLSEEIAAWATRWPARGSAPLLACVAARGPVAGSTAATLGLRASAARAGLGQLTRTTPAAPS